MMDPEVKKLYLGDTWAIDGLRSDPKEYGLDRKEGWPESYEQKASGNRPELKVWNQLQCEAVAALKMKLSEGFVPWDPDVNWIADDVAEVYSFVKGRDCKVYRAIKPSGPAHGGGVDPTSEGQSHWEKY